MFFKVDCEIGRLENSLSKIKFMIIGVKQDPINYILWPGFNKEEQHHEQVAYHWNACP